MSRNGSGNRESWERYRQQEVVQERNNAHHHSGSDQSNQHGTAAAGGQGLGLGVSAGDGTHLDRAIDCYQSGGNSYAGFGPIGVCTHPDGHNSVSYDSGGSAGGSGGEGCIIG